MRAGGVRVLLKRSYRLPDSAVAELTEHLDELGEWTHADADAEVLYDHPAIALSDNGRSLALRYGLSDGFCELRLETRHPKTAPIAPIFAAGPVEQVLTTLGFSEVRRTVMLRQVFSLPETEVQVVHAEPGGWSCELRVESEHAEQTTDALERRLGLDRYERTDPSSRMGTPWKVGDGVRTDRRHDERRVPGPPVAFERRSGPDRRAVLWPAPLSPRETRGAETSTPS